MSTPEDARAVEVKGAVERPTKPEGKGDQSKARRAKRAKRKRSETPDEAVSRLLNEPVSTTRCVLQLSLLTSEAAEYPLVTLAIFNDQKEFTPEMEDAAVAAVRKAISTLNPWGVPAWWQS